MRSSAGGIVQYFVSDVREPLAPRFWPSYFPRDDLAGWRRLAMRLAFKVLAKLRCETPADPVTHTKVITIRNRIEDGLALLQRLQISHQSSIRLRIVISCCGAKGGTLLVGPEIIAELQRMPEPILHWSVYRQQIEVNHAGSGRRPDGTPNTRIQLYDLDVHIVPWMEGWVMLPGRFGHDGRYHG